MIAPVALRPRDERLPAADRQAAAERVLVGGRGVEQPEVAGQLLGDDAVRVDPAGHDPRPGPVQHLAAGGVAGLLDAGLVARRQQRVRQQRQPARDPLGDQDLLRPYGEPAGSAQVGGDLLAELGEPVRVGQPGREVRAGLPPGAPPGGGVDPFRPGDPGLQVDGGAGRVGPAGQRRGRTRAAERSGSSGRNTDIGACQSRRIRAGVRPAAGRSRCGRGDVGHVRAGAVTALEPALREQAGVGVGDHRPADAERGREVAAGRQPVPRAQHAAGDGRLELRRISGRRAAPRPRGPRRPAGPTAKWSSGILHDWLFVPVHLPPRLRDHEH